VSRQNLELVRQGYEAWNRGDLGWVLDHTTLDIEFRTAQLFPDTEAVYRGQEGFRRFWSTFREPWTTFLIEVVRLEEVGNDQVLALLRFHGVGRQEVEVALSFAQLITLEGGLVSQLVGFADWREALEAVGLSE
jgi:ketosteroid isomerase-like protein